MKLSIIIPIYNEKENIINVLDKVNNVDIGDVEKEIILVDDFSTDGTREILKSFEKNHTVLYHKKNYGKGMAVRSGLRYVTGDFVLIQDFLGLNEILYFIVNRHVGSNTICRSTVGQG